MVSFKSKLLSAGAAFCQLGFMFSFAHPAAGQG